LLLRHLFEKGKLDNIAFKGGTALRKLYAGTSGRFSLDLDFSIVRIGDGPDEILMDLIAAIEGMRIGPFQYGIAERRGKWSITYEYDYGVEIALSSKLDISPPPWLSPIFRNWIPMPIHKQYGTDQLPCIQTIRLEENIAEKISRLNRSTPARDMYDLAWIATNSKIVKTLNKPLIRRMAILKNWVDANGIHIGKTWWRPGFESFILDLNNWLRDRSKEDFDIDDIGTLAVPAPTAKYLSETVSIHYSFLADLDDDEHRLAEIKEQDRALAIKLLSELPDQRLAGIGLY
jgi:predicted nucleotidyltransferase component of viral defense system